VYSAQEREKLREALVAAAHADDRIGAAAIFGSGAQGVEDSWSDVDLAFRVADPKRLGETLNAWTELVYGDYGAVHHVDLTSGETVYRVFLLGNTLQVDLAFSPDAEFGAHGPKFRLLFGAAEEQPQSPPPSAAYLIGFGWLYALHARSAIERGRSWQAEFMISGVRDQVLALACLRHGLPAEQGRGVDRLPRAVTAQLESALVRSLDRDELKRAFRLATTGLLDEIGHFDSGLLERLQSPLTQLAG
jgi:predicted nucleotidyltransferase